MLLGRDPSHWKWRFWYGNFFKIRFPIKDKLVKKGVLHESHDGFIFGCEVTKNVSELFFECAISSSVWNKSLIG